MTRRDDYDDMREKGLAPHLSYPVKIVGAIILISVALIGLSALLMAAAGNGFSSCCRAQFGAIIGSPARRYMWYWRIS